MKTILLLSLGLLCFSAQGQTIERCLSHRAIEYQESLTPGYKEHVNSVFENAKAHESNYLLEKSLKMKKCF